MFRRPTGKHLRADLQIDRPQVVGPGGRRDQAAVREEVAVAVVSPFDSV
jgi:hypothetical protein